MRSLGGGFDERLGSFADGFLARKIALRFGLFFEPKVVATWVVFPDSVSRKTALDPQRAQHILDVVPALIAADPGFPPWYADAFRDRWRFATCRLALAAEPIDRELLRTMAAGTAEQRASLQNSGAARSKARSPGHPRPFMVSVSAGYAHRSVADHAGDSSRAPGCGLSLPAISQ